MILKTRNKKLENDNIQLRAKLSSSETLLNDAQQELVKQRALVEELQTSLKHLEEDLSKGDSRSGTKPASGTVGNVSEPDEKMLQIVTNQRDRFKVRMNDLEAENKQFQHHLQSKDTELSAMKQDNIKLYEKIRYLQSYGTKFKVIS